MSKRVNSLENNVPAFGEDALSAESFPTGPSTESHADSSRSYSGTDWLLLTDQEYNLANRWSLGHVSLNYEETSEILGFYALHYSEHLPILERVESISEFHDANPFLFWTIIRVATYNNPSYCHLFAQLTEPYQHLLTTRALSPIRDFKTLQALIITCYWPTSGLRQSNDSSWQYCGIALNTAMQMGLDQPGPGRRLAAFGGLSNAHLVSVYTRQMTWLACFCISTILSVWLGISPHCSSSAQLSTIATMSHHAECPRAFLVQVEIQRQVVRYSTSLGGDVDSSTYSSLMNLFSNELDTLYAMYKNIWTTRLEIQLLRAKLYLYSHCINVAWKAPAYEGRFGEQANPDSVRMLMHQGFHSAISLIHKSQKLNFPSSLDAQAAPSSGVLIHHPKFYLQTVVFAVVFLLKFLSTNQKVVQQDRELAYSHITIAHQIFSGFSYSPESLRVVGVIEHLVQNLKENDNQRTPTVHSRLGASLMYNTLIGLPIPMQTQDTADGALHNDQIPEVVVLAASDHPSSDSAPITWESEGMTNPFATPQSTLHDELGGFQWNPDQLFFDVREL